jgi:hypothetical protein
MPTAAELDRVLEDPLLTTVPLEYEALFYPYGFPARIRSNAAIILTAAEASYGTYRRKFEIAPLDVRLLVAESPSAAPAALPVLQSQKNLLSLVADAENFASLELDTGFAFAWVTRATAENTDYLRQYFLDVVICCLLEVRHIATKDQFTRRSFPPEH